MKTLTKKYPPKPAITVILVILAFMAIFSRMGVPYPHRRTRDARFRCGYCGHCPDVSGLISQVNIKDNQLVKKDQFCSSLTNRVTRKR